MIQQTIVGFARYVRKSRFQFITILTGLCLGMTVSVLIYIYVREETRFDSYHKEGNSLYRVNTMLEIEGKTDRTAKAALNTGQALMQFYPEIEGFTQFLNVSKQTIRVADEMYSSDKVVYADSNAFIFFSFPFIAGNPLNALNGPGKAVVSSAIAQQYFGSVERAFQQTIEVNKKDYLITGIYDEKGGQTHLPYTIFLSLATLPQEFLSVRNREYMWLTTYNYIKLRKGVAPENFRTQLASFHKKVMVPYVSKAEVNGSIKFEIEPVRNIHLNNTLRFDFPGAINPNYLKIFSAVGVLTLLIALINYINLTTAKISKRIKEVGIKKFLGASRAGLFMQFVFETTLTAFIAFCIALILVYFALPELNNLTGTSYTFQAIFDAELIIASGCFVVLFGLLGSIYPAFLLTSFKPLNAIRSFKNIRPGYSIEHFLNPSMVRRVLVTAQFTISIFLIIGTIVIFQQFKFMNSKSLGFDQHQVLVIDIPNDTTISNHLDVVKNALLENSAVKSVSSSSSIPGSDHGALTMNFSQTGGSEIKVINTYTVDENFMKTLNLDLVKGRFFAKEFSTDPQEAFIINEAAAKFLGWDESLEKKVESPFGQKGMVVGLLKDFNYKSLHSSIEPLILMNSRSSQGYLLVKISTDNLQGTVSKISQVWIAFDPSHPYEYFFLDTQFQMQYIKEQRLIIIFAYFSAFAIFISCLGLIGLAIFTNETRVKEIGIRKTLGATNSDIVTLLSKGFVIPILIATLFAWIISFYMVRDWLTQFAYRVDLTILPFFLGAAIALGIASLTIGYFASLAAKQDITSSLRYE
jgi:putative ABC transport system permease protein